jgi:ribosome biogenesis GTPase
MMYPSKKRNVYTLMPKPKNQDMQPGQDGQDDQHGLVISYFGNSVAVEASDGQVIQCHLRRNQELPVVGDRVRFQAGANNTGVIVGIEPRRSVLSRGQAQGRAKPIAANIDAIILVMSPPPIFAEYLIDRYLVAAELLNIAPILVMNKADLLDDSSRPQASTRLMPYQHIPYPVFLSSTYTKAGLAELGQHLVGKTAVLVGPSGVGKSSLITALGSQIAIQTGEVTNKGVGKHTTTATRLYHLPQGGQLIDSPGVREFNLWQVSQNEVLRGFKEFQSFLTGCKFRDCLHMVEPGCAVQEAVANGKISAQRYANYQELMKEAASYKKY